MKILLALLLLAAATGAPASADSELVVLTYDSFLAKGGLGSVILPIFEKKCGCRVKALSVGDAGQMLTRLELDAERGKATAQVVIGIDQLSWERVRAKGLAEDWGDWVPEGYVHLVERAKVVKGFLPIDYGAYAFMLDRQAIGDASPPGSLADLLGPRWKRNLILEDPRTSAPGLAFLLYTESVLGEKAWDYWRSLRSQWLTLAPGWSAAYQLFSKKEAPLVWSYTTSQAYHEEHGDSADPGKRRYQALLFNEGQPLQIEGAAWIKGSTKTEAQRKRVKDFLEFLISAEVQERVAKTNWMYPVAKNVKLPGSFSHLPESKSWVRMKSSPDEIARILSRWSRIVEGD